MRRAVPGITLRVAGRPTASETTYARVGAHVLVVATALPELGISLTSTYVGAEDVDTIAVDLLLGHRPAASSQPRTLPRDVVPVTHAHDRCLLDHAAQLRDGLHELGHSPAAVDVGDQALAALTALT